MKRLISAVLLAVTAALLLATPAWGTQSVTKQLPGVPCSVTSSYTFYLSARAMGYAGGISCAGGVGQKTLNVVPQVLNTSAGRRMWFTISLAAVYQGPIAINPLRLSASRAAMVGHVYRVLTYGRVTLPSGRTAWTTTCAGMCTDPATLSIAATHRYAPQPPLAAKIGGSPCSLTEDGPVFTVVNGSWVMSYAGWVACSPGTVPKSLALTAEVAGSGANRGRYFTLTGSGLSAGLTARTPLALSTARSAYLGHGYRIKAAAAVTYSGKTYMAAAYSKTYAP
jgi:hypothetical protein